MYVAHDNVPLGEAMRGKKSDVLIETKHSSGKLCFVYGRVGYSGPAGEAPDASGALQLGSRGCWVLSLESCHARCVDPATKRRLATFECLSLMEGEAIPFSSVEDCRSFLEVVRRGLTWSSRRSGCGTTGGRRNLWCPSMKHLTCRTGTQIHHLRRLAPQFRSAGVGYIRLGDDMSRNGLSFISCDAASFLLDAGHARAPSTGRRRLEVAAPVDPSPLARSRKGVFRRCAGGRRFFVRGLKTDHYASRFATAAASLRFFRSLPDRVRATGRGRVPFDVRAVV